MATPTIIGLRELREHTERYIRAVGKGKSFTVVRRSKPVFEITPIDEDDDRFWDTIIDFAKIRSGGVPAREVAKWFAASATEERRKRKHSRRSGK